MNINQIAYELYGKYFADLTVGGMVSCRLRAIDLSNYIELQAGGNASNYYKHGN